MIDKKSGLEFSLDELEIILQTPKTDPKEIYYSIKSNHDTIFTWDYSKSRKKIIKLYEKAKKSQWNPSDDIDWNLGVDIEKSALGDLGPINTNKFIGTPLEKWGQKEWLEYRIEAKRYNFSQFCAGEQAALMFASKIVETIPWYEAKLYASTQVTDEAKHLDAFSRYLEKIGGGYPVNSNFKNYVNNIINDSRWDIVYLGGQVIGEGLALASFSHMYAMTNEELLKQMLKLIIRDESRHVAFGVVSLMEAYEDLTDLEIKERQEFAYEASIGLLGRFVQIEVWEKMGVNPKDIIPLVINSGKNRFMRQAVFTKVVPNCKKLGLLDRNNGWLRKRFEELGVIQFEDMELTDEEI
jgi:rubrerythrin